MSYPITDYLKEINENSQKKSISYNGPNEGDSFVLWLTGLPCSGKTTIAKGLKEYFEYRYLKVAHIDGDEFRKNITPELGFSKKDRFTNLMEATNIAKTLFFNGLIVICSFVSPYLEDRKKIQSNFYHDNFLEIRIDASPETCEKRDVKGMWKKARDGEIKGFTGYDAPYERSPVGFCINTEVADEQMTIELAADYIENWRRKAGEMYV